VGWGADLLAAKSIGTTGVYASLEFGRDGEGNTALAWGLACDRALGGRWGMAAEIRGERAAGEGSLSGLAGLTYRVRDGVILDFGVRRERACGDTSRGWTVGVTREW
jgi:hypothetical protein